MNKNQLKKVINNLQTYVDDKIDNLPASYEEKLLMTVPKEKIDKSKADVATVDSPYTINIPVANGFEYVDGMFNNADIVIEYNGKKYMSAINTFNDGVAYGIESENNNFGFSITKDNSSDIQLIIAKLDTTNITDIKVYMRKKDININDLKVGKSISIGRKGNIGIYSSAIGNGVEASGAFSHAEGDGTTASGMYTHAEGKYTTASGESSHAEGYYTKASSEYQHVQGKYNIEDTANKYAHIVGNGTSNSKRSNAHTLDWKGNAWFAGEVQGSNIPHVISEETVLTVPASSIDKTKAAAATVDAPYKLDVSSVFTQDNAKEYFITYGGKTFDINNDNIKIYVGHNAEGAEDATKTQIVINKLDTTNVTDIKVVAKEIQYLDDLYLDKDLKIKNSISVGNRMGAIGKYSSAIGSNVIASGESSHAEGMYTEASGKSSHAEGGYTIASGDSSHAEGVNTEASGDSSHAEGANTEASGLCSHVEGGSTIASGEFSHAEGENTKASSDYQHVQGRYNIEDTANKYAHIVGNGKKDSSTNYEEIRSNAHTLDWEGNAWYAGQVEGTNLPYTISSKVLGTVPASTVSDNIPASDERVLAPITINNVSINKDRRYYIEFLGSKKICNLSINEENKNSIMCSIGNYIIQAYNNSTNILINIDKINTNDTTATTFTDLVIYEEEVKYLDSKYLETDLTIQNSVSLGRVGDIGAGSSAIGDSVIASGNSSHAEGSDTKASGTSSHAEGFYTKASGTSSHAEGDSTTASGESSHAEGFYTSASANSSHAEGYQTKASSDYQHVQGKFNIEDTAKKYAHIVGNGTASNKRSNAHTLDWEGNAWYAGQVEGTNLPYTVSSKVLDTVSASNVKLDNPITVNNVSINKDRRYYIEFLNNKKLCNLLINEEEGDCCIICSINNYTIQAYNDSTNIILNISKINTDDTTTDTFTDLVIYEEENSYLDIKYLETDLILQNSISLGRVGNIGPGSSAIGCGVEASGMYSHAEGESTIASGYTSHAEGFETTASGDNSHAEGFGATASGKRTHAEGYNTIATNFNSHAEGWCTKASGNNSHAEGASTTASGFSSHAEGDSTKASSDCQHVQGKYNIEDTANKYAHIVGNGHYDEETKTEVRSDAHTLDWEGNAWYSGKLSQEGTPTEDKDLVTKKYVDEHSISVIDGFTMRDQTTNYKYLMQLRDGVLTSILLPSSISVDSSSLTNLNDGDIIEGKDLVINATYPDGTTSALSDSDKKNITCTPKELTTDVKQITVKYKVGDYELTQIIDVTVSAFDPAVKLQDFNYTSNADGTYTLTGWKETHNGVASTEMIIPNNKKIIL